MRVGVTGGLGYIGSNIVGKLLKDGHEVIVFDNMTTSVHKSLHGVEMIKVDITNFDAMKKIRIDGLDALLHLAAQSSGPKSIECPDLDIQVNILGTLNMVKWCELNSIKRLLFASTFTVYGDHPEKPLLSEDDYCNPKSLYGTSKFAAENYLKICAEKMGIQWNILRMFNVYGPGQDLARKDQGMVSIFLSMVREGNHVPVKGSLERFRDFVYIDDVVSAWTLCLNKPECVNDTFNVGSGVKVTIGQLIDDIITVYGKNGQVKVEESGVTPGDIQGCYADVSKIGRALAFKPQFSIAAGLKEFKAWADTLPT